MPVLKFLLVMSILLLVNNTMGYAKALNKTTVILMMSVIGAFLPSNLIMLGTMTVVSIHAVIGSLEAGGIVVAMLLITYLLFVRLYPTESLFIIGIVIAYKFNLPYIIPLLAGLFSSLAAVVSVGIGTIIWYVTPQFVMMMQGQASELSDIVEVMNANLLALQGMFRTDPTILASVTILSAVLLTVHLIKRQNIDYAGYIAVLVGAVMNMVGFLFAIILLKVDVGIIPLILATIICALIATVAQFFAKVADYSRAETVEFEDAENYYYVKVVPKILVKKPEKQIKHIYTNDEIQYKSHENY